MNTFVLLPLATTKPNEFKVNLQFCRESYLNKLIPYGLTPLFVSPSMTSEMINEMYNLSKGLFLTGGADISPDHYGEVKHEKTRSHEIDRDKIEIDLVKKTVKDKKPFLGICRGAQLLNVALGGTLTQCIKEKEPIHQHDFGKYDNIFNSIHHKVYVKKPSHLFNILKKDTIMVNSNHHQAIRVLGNDLVVSGETEDNIVEVIEHTDKDYFCFGIQSHPEAEENGDLEPLFKEFAKVLKLK